MPDIIKWPQPGLLQHPWYWMRCRTSRQSKWRVLLVEIIVHSGQEYVRPLGDPNCFPRDICEGWEAEFVSAEPPPEEWRHA